ncbi:hypothetical protein [Georgenia sp. AZ-5]|uniref:hypothetical protein n=1 Tax=Georgenia sp. AZ-5 TaxID=3367526 RepID=UPI003754DB25
MPDYENPVPSAQEAAEAVRALAHATRSFGDDTSGTYWVVGELLSTARRLEQVLHQGAAAHHDGRDKARGEDGSPVTGRAHALTAAGELRRAAQLLGQAEAHLNAASKHSGKIVWASSVPLRREPPPTPILPPARSSQQNVGPEEVSRRMGPYPGGPGLAL